MTGDAIALGAVGFGRHLRRYLLPNVIGDERLRLRAVAERNPALRDEAEARLPGVRVFDDAEALFQDGSCEAVLVSTDPASHVPLTGRALRAGLHVLVEKPLGTSAREVVRLARLADERGLVAMNGLMWRWAAATAVLGEQLRRHGASTRLLSLSVTLPAIDLRPAWRPDWGMSLRDNAFFDAFIHPIDWATLFVGPVETVEAREIRCDEDTGEVVACLALGAGDPPRLATLCLVAGSAAYQVTAWGHLSDGSLWELDSLQRLRITRQPTWSGTEGGMRDRATLGWEPGQLYRGWGRQGYAEELHAFAEAIRGTDAGLRERASNLSSVAHSMTVIEAACASLARGGATVAVALLDAA